MSKFENTRKTTFIDSLSKLTSLFDDDNDLTKRCKFNFSYFDASQKVGQKFHEWNHKQLADLFGKLKDYTTKPLDSWGRERVGKTGLTVLAIYGKFPNKSEFVCPAHVPHQVQWARFRLGYKLRLIGFIVPGEFHKTVHPKTNEIFDKNTFYVVFLDQDHKFYLTEKN